MADSNQCGPDTAFITIQIVDQPIAGLVSAVDSVCSGDAVLFTNISTGGNQSLIDFGEGAGFQGMGASVTHTYGAAGNYTIRLVHTLAGGTNSCRDTAQVQLEVLPSPVPQANIAPGGGCDSAQVSFINSSSGGATYFWDFGNGDTSSLQNPPPIFYNTEGQTPVTLFVTSINGCVATDTAFVEIYDTPVASFGLQNVCEDALATFFDSTTVGYGGPITQWTWSFGDPLNTASNLQNPNFLYADSGVYVISLIASTPFCTDSTSQTIVVEAKPFASFDESDSVGCSPLNATFTNTSTGAATYAWDFGDGNTSVAVSPNHTFVHNALSDTNYIVRLVAFSAFGCVDTVYDTVLVRGNPVAAFSSDASLDCAPLIVNFTDNSAGAIGWNWDFGDATGSTNQNPTKTFNNQTQFITNYTVNLIVTAPNGCTDAAQEVVTVYPEPLFNFSVVPTSGCSPLTVNFPVAIGAVVYNWDFGDGNTSTVPNPSHTYVNNSVNNQVFNIQLVATSPFGCVDSVQGSVTVFPLPNANITPNYSQGCPPFTANFTNSSTGGTTYTWDFDNGTTLTTANNTVSSLYTNSTNDTLFYTPKLYAFTPDGCVDSTTAQVGVFKRVEASFSVPTPACHPYNALFTDLSINATNWSWDFDNGLSSNQQNPQIFFLNATALPQTFDVELTVNSLEGCTDDSIVQMVVNPKPLADFTIDDSPACHGEEVLITNNSTQNDVNTWRYGLNGPLEVDNNPVIDTSFLNFNQNPIQFPIRLVVDNIYGCSDTIIRQMQVFPVVDAQFAAIDEGCSPFEVEFNNFSTGGSLFEWNFGDGDNSFLEEPEHTFLNTTAEDTVYQVILAITSPFGCEDADSFDILVHPTPLPQFTVNPTNQVFPNSTVGITNITPAGPWNYLWEFGDGDTSSVEDPIEHMYATWGIFDITLTVSSAFCEDELTRTIVIHPPLPVAEFDTLVDACAPVSIQFSSNSLYGERFFWEFGDGGTSSAENPFYTYQFPGSYTVRLTVTGPGGEVDTKEIIDAITVNEQPLANFVFTPDEVNVPLESVSFINYSQYAQFYEWDFGDGVTSVLENPQHAYGAAGQFFPELIAYTEFGCADTFQSAVPVRGLETGVLQVPNAFTPSETGPGNSIYDPLSFDNTVFFPLLSGVSSGNYILSVFNRWGELLFETHNVFEGWNGYYRGKPCVQDAYVWKINGEYVNGERFTKVGDVTLIQ